MRRVLERLGFDVVEPAGNDDHEVPKKRVALVYSQDTWEVAVLGDSQTVAVFDYPFGAETLSSAEWRELAKQRPMYFVSERRPADGASSALAVCPRFSDFGLAAEGERRDFAFRLRNTGHTQLHIVDVRPGCSCIRWGVTKRILEAGEETVLEMMIDTRGSRGFQAVPCYVATDGGTVIRLLVTGFVSAGQSLFPASVDFGHVGQKDRARRKVYFPLSQQLRTESLKVNGEGPFEGRWVQANEFSGGVLCRALSVSFDGSSCGIGVHRGKVILSYSRLGRAYTTEAALRVVVVSKPVVGRFFLGSIEPGKGTHRLVPLSGLGLSLEGGFTYLCHTDDSRLRAAVVADSGGYALDLVLNPLTPGSWHSFVSILPVGRNGEHGAQVFVEIYVLAAEGRSL